MNDASYTKLSNLFTHRVSIHAVYYKIACEQAAIYHTCDAELSTLEIAPVREDGSSFDQRRIEECYGERTRSSLVSITFSGMALEAFYYDYAAQKLGDSYVIEHLDKLDLKSKYLLYPKLICGEELEKSSSVYEKLKKLVKLRNDLVHFKSKPFTLDKLYNASEFHDKLNERLKVGVDEALNCVDQIMLELDSLHGHGSHFMMKMKW